jgi:hypothetical protein
MNAVKAKILEEPAADHLSTIDWQRGEWTAAPGQYSRQHLWVLAGAKLKASDCGALLPAAYRDKVAINPHNMFVATISSAHMLTLHSHGEEAHQRIESMRRPTSARPTAGSSPDSRPGFSRSAPRYKRPRSASRQLGAR